MGTQLFDKYTLLHFAWGIAAYLFGVPLWLWVVAHVLFEYFENSSTGMHFINNHFNAWWPGGKPAPDTCLNSLGDNIGAIAGWILGFIVGNYFKR